jgi:hypothetical protein
MDEYGNVLGRLVCMYIRMLNQEDEFGVVDHDLTASQRQKIQDLKEALWSDARSWNFLILRRESTGLKFLFSTRLLFIQAKP